MLHSSFTAQGLSGSILNHTAGSEQATELAQTLHQSVSSPGWSCAILALGMSHPNRLCHPVSLHNPKTQLPRMLRSQICAARALPVLLSGPLYSYMANTKLPLETPKPAIRLHCSLQGAGLAHSGILSQINHSHDSSGYFAIRKALLLSIPGSVLSPILGLSLKHSVGNHCQSEQNVHCALCTSCSFLTRNITALSLTWFSTEILQQSCLLLVSTPLVITLPSARIWRNSCLCLQLYCGTAVSSLPFWRTWETCEAELPWKHRGNFPQYFSLLWAQNKPGVAVLTAMGGKGCLSSSRGSC